MFNHLRVGAKTRRSMFQAEGTDWVSHKRSLPPKTNIHAHLRGPEVSNSNSDNFSPLRNLLLSLTSLDINILFFGSVESDLRILFLFGFFTFPH